MGVMSKGNSYPSITSSRNLLADEALLGETESVTNDELYAAAQALLNEIQPQLNFNPEQEVTMFVMDMPPDVPVQNTPVVIAMASHDKKAAAKADRTIGVCHLIENQPDSRYSAVNNISPLGQASVYLEKQEHLKLDWKSWKLSVLQKPKHGTLEMGTSAGQYYPTPDYFGPDRATFLVEIGKRKVKVLYFFKVMPEVAGGNDAYNPYYDKKNCPKGKVWKISLNPDDPSGSFFTSEQSFSIQNTLNGFKPEIVFADLPGEVW
jgi:hypothetical protein